MFYNKVNSDDLIELFKNNDIKVLERLPYAKLLCPISFDNKILKDKMGNIKVAANNNIHFKMVNNDIGTYFLAYTSYEKNSDPDEMIVMNLHDYYQLFCMDGCKALGIVINLNSDNILLDKEMVIKLGYRQVDKAVNYFEPEIYPSNIIEKIEEYAIKHRDLKECYFKNYLKDDKIAFALIIKGINPNKIIRELNTMIKPLVKNMDISIVVKNEENEDACIKNLIGK